MADMICDKVYELLMSILMLYKYGVNFTASMIIVLKLRIFNYCVSQPPAIKRQYLYYSPYT
jgi:hypothetical protein